MFLARLLSLNFFLIGWLADGLSMESVNKSASKNEQEARELAPQERLDFVRLELVRIRSIPHDSTKQRITHFLSYSRAVGGEIDVPWKITEKYLVEKENEAKAWCQEVNKAWKDTQMADADGDEDEEAEEDSEEESEEEEDEDDGEEDAKQDDDDDGQSDFAWFADFVVVINALTMAAVGFNDAITPLLDGVGYFASIFFIVEAYIKSIAYGGLGYYLNEPSNSFDFVLVVTPTIGEVTTQVTDFLGLGNDYIYQALALQALRVFRIGKLTKHLTGLRDLTSRAFGSPKPVVFALLVTIGFVCFMAFFGNELFSTEIQFAQARNDFQYFLSSMQTMLEFLLGDRYFETTEIGWSSGSFVGIFFFISYYYVANFLVLRMFIALILENFEYDEDEKINIQIQLYQRKQIDMNELIDGKAREMSLEEQFKRLEKQNLDERYVFVCVFARVLMCMQTYVLIRAYRHACMQILGSCALIAHFNLTSPPFPFHSIALRAPAFSGH